MQSFNFRNVHEALPTMIEKIQELGVRSDSRNGEVIQFTTPVTTSYEKPCERVLYWKERDANPFFHLFESIWMLAGRNDVEFLSKIVKSMEQFSDDGRTFHGAYGFRWREHFATDQLETIIEALKKNPEDRRCVLAMWDGNEDLGKEGKDFPCNLSCAFLINRATGALDMTVYNRSNDLVWGAYGANAVHFSFLLEFMANAIGVPVGTYYQVSNNLHMYDFNSGNTKEVVNSEYYNPYEDGTVKSVQLISNGETYEEFLEDCETFCEDGGYGFDDANYNTGFFNDVVKGLGIAYYEFKNYHGELKGEKKYNLSSRIINSEVVNCDWKVACTEWLQRKYDNYKQKEK